ncbi:rhamnogalacturonan lyase [Paraflavisolibacter sp. H34]|uniref:rhamnogalacturonan lyase n=1 Tax=Huijunlia imazamoxiresistens TaxID=3127457 RepID=UPI003019BEFB
MKKIYLPFLTLAFLLAGKAGQAQRRMEHLGRGVVALRSAPDSVVVSWRLLATDADDISFNLYRSTANGQPVKLNSRPLTQSTFFVDTHFDTTRANGYFVKPLLGGKEGDASGVFTLAAGAPVRNYLSLPLQTPAGYTPNDASVGDLDGDGEYEIVLHQAGAGRDNSQAGFTDKPLFQAYKLDGTLLWTINLGKNIREGAHYTQFMVYDLDGDGKAEVAMKTADGTIDGKGKVIGDSTKDFRIKEGRMTGKVLDGPEYFTIFSGETGEALATTDYIPSRYPTAGWGGPGGNGGTDNNGNRVDRFTACVAYLDGQLPSVVMCRGYYGRSVLAAWDWRGGKLTSRWVFDSRDGKNPFSGQGYHNLSVADVDQDGKDEIVYGSMVVDDNGKGLFSTGLRHGDALHVSDLDPARPGLEVFGVHEIEEGTKGPGAALYDAATGKILWTGNLDEDAGRGVAENIDPKNPGAEMWWSGSRGLFNTKGERIGNNPPSTNFLIWWDGDRTRELLDGNGIDKYGQGRIFTAWGCMANNGSKSNPTLSADLLGDWREEVVFRTADRKELRIFSTTIPTAYRQYTLMHDPQYRLSVAWQNVGYNQPPHLSFYMGEDMPRAPKPVIAMAEEKNSRHLSEK